MTNMPGFRSESSVIPIQINNTTLAPFFTPHLFSPKNRKVKESEKE